MDETIDEYIALSRKALFLGIPCFTSLDTATAATDIIASHYTQQNTELVTDLTHTLEIFCGKGDLTTAGLDWFYQNCRHRRLRRCKDHLLQRFGTLQLAAFTLFPERAAVTVRTRGPGE